MADRRRHGAVLVSGYSNSGKTTLMERLIPRLRARGLRVGTIKHAHDGFAMDHPGTDSWRHARAGAAAVAVIAPTRAAWLVKTPEELSCTQAIKRMTDDVDVVLVEGFKRAAGPKILLEPGMGARLTVGMSRCRIGVRPDALTPTEWRQIAQFCARHARRSRATR